MLPNIMTIISEIAVILYDTMLVTSLFPQPGELRNLWVYNCEMLVKFSVANP